jgi:uncharacterized protein GlcG (DUF336 family)
MPRSTKTRRLQFEALEVRHLLNGAAFFAAGGDWNGDGGDGVALYDAQSGRFYLRDATTPGYPDSSLVVEGHGPNSVPIVGDWNAGGRDTTGILDAGTGEYWLVASNGSLIEGQVALPPGSGHYVAGDWDGDGDDSLGYYDPATGLVHLQSDLASNMFDQMFQFWPGGLASVPAPENASPDAWRLVSGNFDGVGGDGIGLYNGATGRFFLKEDPTATVVSHVFAFGPGGNEAYPIVGDWDGDGLATIGVFEYSSGVFSIKNSLAGGVADGLFYVVPSTTHVGETAGVQSFAMALGPPPLLTAADVEFLLKRAAAASASEDAIIAIVDRNGRILGVRAEADVLATIADEATLVFAIDGAVAKARTAALFANGDGDGGVGPLTSRTVRFISQSTVTQREVESNPNDPDPDSTTRGPGFVAPIGLGGHFPPAVKHTPPVDLFAIEHTNRDSIVHPGLDSIKGTVDDVSLMSRFNIDPAFTPAGQDLFAPESYGFVSKRLEDAQSRGIATLPGGLPIYKPDPYTGQPVLVGGIGVFFPGEDGYATHEQGFVPLTAAQAKKKKVVAKAEKDRTNAAKVLEAEWIAYAALGGSSAAAKFVKKPTVVGTLDGIPRDPAFDLPFGRIDLVGITLELYGPGGHIQGVKQLLKVGAMVGAGDSMSGADQVVDPGGDMDPDTPGDNIFHLDGVAVPDGWLVLPHAGSMLSMADVETIIDQGIAEAEKVRAAIRLPLGSRTQMVFAVSDKDGEILGLFRMPDATVFSIDVAVAKARNVAYYADASVLADEDRVDDNGDGIPDANVPAGTAFTNRTFRFLAEPRYPSGVDGSLSGAFSILRDAGIDPRTGENMGAPVAASSFDSVLGFDAFNPGRNFRDPDDIANQNGIVFFPGSTPLYVGGMLVGGLGVSGDGVDQDDVVTHFAAVGYETPSALRADKFQVRKVRLPFIKFNRNPRA